MPLAGFAAGTRAVAGAVAGAAGATWMQSTTWGDDDEKEAVAEGAARSRVKKTATRRDSFPSPSRSARFDHFVLSLHPPVAPLAKGLPTSRPRAQEYSRAIERYVNTYGVQ